MEKEIIYAIGGALTAAIGFLVRWVMKIYKEKEDLYQKMLEMAQTQGVSNGTLTKMLDFIERVQGHIEKKNS